METLSFTCNSCRVAFVDADLQREHYRTEWHRYNLKRKVAEMTPVTLDNFNQRAQALSAKAADAKEDKSSYCSLCGKHFNTTNSYENHIKSKKHKELELKQERILQGQIEEMNAKNAEKGLPTVNNKVAEKALKNEALKASLHQSTDGDQSRQDGTKPKAASSGSKVEAKSSAAEEAVMEVDEESEEEWDGEALGDEECLFCSKISDTLDANIKHMTHKHSFFIPDIEYLVDLNGLITYLGMKVGEGHVCLWCNEKGRMFHSTKAVQQHMVDKGHCKMLHDGDAVFEYADFYDYRSSYPDYEEHQLSEAAGGAPADGEELQEEEVKQEFLEELNFQLVLPSGSTIGHRSLQRYYRQKLKPSKYDRNPSSVSRVISQYRALGWTGTIGADAQRRAKDVQYIHRIRSRRNIQMGMKNNKMQFHFRPQVIF